MKSITIQVPSLVDNIRIVESFIDNAKEKHNISDDIYGNIMIAITEAVNNAIRHGNKEDKSKLVRLSLILDNNHVRFIVEDEGEGFNYEDLNDPTAPENLDKPGGRGIFLMKHLSDGVKFSQEGRCVELQFNIW